MKSLLAIAFALCASFSYAQQAQPDSLFIVTYTTGPAWDAAKAFQGTLRQPQQAAKGRRDKSGSQVRRQRNYFYESRVIGAARKIVFADEAVANKLFNAEVQKLNVFYDGCIEKITEN